MDSKQKKSLTFAPRLSTYDEPKRSPLESPPEKSPPETPAAMSGAHEQPGVQTQPILRGAMDGIYVILVKNHLFILFNKFDLHSIIYDSLMFQTSITVVQSFIRTCK